MICRSDRSTKTLSFDSFFFILRKLTVKLTKTSRRSQTDQKRGNDLAEDEIDDSGGHLKIKFLMMTPAASV